MITESVCNCVLGNGHFDGTGRANVISTRKRLCTSSGAFCKQSIQRYDVFVSEMDVFRTALACRAILSIFKGK